MNFIKIIELLLHSNTFVRYKHLFTSGQKWQLFKHFKPRDGSFSVVTLYISEETLESPFHAELNGHCPNSVY